MTLSRDRVAVAALAGLAVLVVLVVVQHPLRADDLPAGEHFVSEYARGSTAALQVVAFVCWAVSLGLTARLAAGDGDDRERSRSPRPALCSPAASRP